MDALLILSQGQVPAAFISMSPEAAESAASQPSPNRRYEGPPQFLYHGPSGGESFVTTVQTTCPTGPAAVVVERREANLKVTSLTLPPGTGAPSSELIGELTEAMQDLQNLHGISLTCGANWVQLRLVGGLQQGPEATWRYVRMDRGAVHLHDWRQ